MREQLDGTDSQILVDAHDPERSISCNQARRIVRHLIAGLRAAGVKPGDCVGIHAFNDVSADLVPGTGLEAKQ